MHSQSIFLSSENECQNKTVVIFKNELNYFKKFLNFYTKLAYNLNPLRWDPNSQHAMDFQDLSIVLINLKIINSLSCNSQLICNGYYNDASNILRNIHESRFLSQYFVKFPQAADEWLDGKQIPHSLVIKGLRIPDVENEIYGLFCDYTHSNYYGTNDHLEINNEYPVNRHDNTQLDIRVRPTFNIRIAKRLFWIQIIESYDAMTCFYRYFNSMYWMEFDLKFEKQKIKVDKKFSELLKHCRETRP